MKAAERPILFNDAMVRALLAGRKTQTRRVAKPQPQKVDRTRLHWTKWRRERDLGKPLGGFVWDHRDPCRFPTPYGVPGDRLWVRETWQPLWADADRAPPFGLKSPEGWAIGYPATDGIQEWHNHGGDGELVTKCSPSIHMPRWASRITLEVTEVRVERLQDISEADAKAEGVEAHDDDGVTYYGPLNRGDARANVAFAKLWADIHGAESWAANPWVWVISFPNAAQTKEQQ